MNKLEEIISLLEDLSRNCINQRHINSFNDVIDILQNIQREEIAPPIATNQNDNLFEFENFGEGVALIAYYGWDQKSIIVPDTYDGKKVIRITKNVFKKCAMQTIRFGKYISVIEEGAVQWCHQLHSVQITSQLRFIGANAFEGCEQLQNINLPDSIIYIGHAAFERTAISTIRVPRSLTYINDRLFSHCKELKKVKIHNDVIAIGYAAFENCSSLEEIELPSSLKLIKEMAFHMCTSLKKAVILSSTVEIGDRAFTDSGDAWYYPPLKNLTVLSQVKSSALLYCRENRLKFQQLESPMTEERESMVQLIDHIGFSTTINSSKLKKYIELNDWVQVESTANVTKVIFTKYTEVPFEHSPITIKDFV